MPNINVYRSDVAHFFQPSIDCIVKAVLEQKNSARITISVSFYMTFLKYRFPNHFQHVVLVGGFAESDWLFTKVHEMLIPFGLNLIRPVNHVWVFFKVLRLFFLLKKSFFRNKAVSDGAISFYVDHFVRTRVSKYTYGNFCTIPYDPSDADHRSRFHNVYTTISGEERISNFFDIILPKVSGLISFLQKYVIFF